MNLIYNSIIRIISYNIDYDYFNPPNIINDEQTIGTGFFIKPKIILTCAHVVENAKTLYYTIPTISDKKYKLKILGLAPDIDIAILLSIDYESPHILSLTNSDNIKLEDSIITIGFPLGQDKIKITKGIISGVQFSNIQIDSAINGGNSGGPLILNNKVIGIVSSKVENASGVGYAIPSNLLYIFDRKKQSSIIYNSCNFYAKFSNTPNNYIKIINNDVVKSGYTLSYIADYSPLKKFNIDIGDVIFEFDNKQINNFGEININQFKYNLLDYIQRLNIDNEYMIKYFSKNNQSINTIIIKFSNQNMMGIKKIIPIIDKLDYINIGGLILTPLTQNIIVNNPTKFRYFYKYNNVLISRVIVVNILPNSYFNISENINKCDIISKINNINIYTIDDIKNILKNISSNDRFLQIETNRNKLELIDVKCI